MSRTCSATTSRSTTTTARSGSTPTSGEELWELFSASAPPVVSLLARLDAPTREEFHQGFVELFEELPRRRRDPRPAPLPARARHTALATRVLELHDPAARSPRSRTTSRDEGFWGRDDVVADLYLGYGLSDPLRRSASAGAARAVPAAAPCLPDPAAQGRGPRRPAVHARRVGANAGRRGLRRRDRGGARCDRARRRLPGQPRPASCGAVRRRSGARSRRARAASRRCSRDRSRSTAGRSSRPRPSSSSHGAGDASATLPIKGTRPAGEDVDAREGRRRARDDRRPRAQRPLARLRARHRSAGPS